MRPICGSPPRLDFGAQLFAHRSHAGRMRPEDAAVISDITDGVLIACFDFHDALGPCA